MRVLPEPDLSFNKNLYFLSPHPPSPPPPHPPSSPLLPPPPRSPPSPRSLDLGAWPLDPPLLVRILPGLNLYPMPLPLYQLLPASPFHLLHHTSLRRIWRHTTSSPRHDQRDASSPQYTMRPMVPPRKATSGHSPLHSGPPSVFTTPRIASPPTSRPFLILGHAPTPLCTSLACQDMAQSPARPVVLSHMAQPPSPPKLGLLGPP